MKDRGLAAAGRGSRRLAFAAAAALLAIVSAVQGVEANDARADAAYEDIAETYGTVPGFFRLFPREDIADVWFEFRTLHLNPYLATDAKVRELISVSVAAQGPCRPCVYFHAAAAFANGATKEEIREAVGIGAATRRLGVFFRDAMADIGVFQREIDLLLWGDTRTIELRGPPAGFCAFIVDWADVNYVGCD